MSGHLLLASAGDDIKVWDTSSYEVVKQFNPHAGNVAKICWSHSNSFLASASTIGDKIGLALTKAAFTCREITAVPDQTCVAVSASSKFILTAGRSGDLNIYDLKSKKLSRSYQGSASPVTCVTFNGNDTYVAGGTEGGEIHLYSTVTGQGAKPLVASPKAQAVQDLQYSYFKKALLASVSDDGSMLLWDTATRCLLHTFAGVHKSPATGLAFSPLNNMLLMSVGLDKTVVFYDVSSKSLPKVMTADCPLTSIDIMSDGHTLAVGTTRGFIYLYDLRRASHPIRTCAAHKSSVRCLRFQRLYKADPDIATGSAKVSKPAISSASASSSPRSAMSVASPRGTAEIAAPDQGYAADVVAPAVSAHGASSPDNFTNLHDVFSPATATEDHSRTSIDPTKVHEADEASPRVGFSAAAAGFNGGGVFSPTVPSLRVGSGATDTAASRGLSPASSRHGSRVLPLLPDDRPQHHLPLTTVQPSNGFVDAGSQDVAIYPAQSGQAIPSPKVNSAQSPINSPLGDQDMKPLHTALPASAHKSPGSPRTSNGGSSVSCTSSRGSSSTKLQLKEKHDVGKLHDSTSALIDQTCPVTAASAQQRTASVETHTASVAGAGDHDLPGPAVLQFQTEFIRSVVADVLDEARGDIQRDIRNLHAEMVRQLHILETEMRRLFASYDITKELLEENQRLREENARLKKTY